MKLNCAPIVPTTHARCQYMTVISKIGIRMYAFAQKQHQMSPLAQVLSKILRNETSLFSLVVIHLSV